MSTSEKTAAHVLVETAGWAADDGRDGFAGAARALAGAGHQVVLVLVQDAVCAIATAPGTLGRLAGDGVTVLVDEFSLLQRGLPGAVLPAGAALTDADRIAGLLLTPGVRVVWH
jgi:hypothetical protein